MSSKITTLDQALTRIKELEAELTATQKELDYYKNRPTSGRKPHNDKWQENYDLFVKLYEDGESIPIIVEKTPFSRRTVYRYKEYYDALHAVKEL